MTNVESKGPVCPGHPTRIQIVVNDIGPDHGIFKDNSDKGVGVVIGSAEIHIGQIIAANDFNVAFAETTITGFDPLLGRLESFFVDSLHRHPACLFRRTIRVRAGLDSEMFDTINVFGIEQGRRRDVGLRNVAEIDIFCNVATSSVVLVSAVVWRRVVLVSTIVVGILVVLIGFRREKVKVGIPRFAET